MLDVTIIQFENYQIKMDSFEWCEENFQEKILRSKWAPCVKEPMKLQITNYEERPGISQEAPNLTILLMEALLLPPNLYQNCVTI